VEVFEGVVTTTTASSPLKYDWEAGICLCDVDDLLDGFDGSRLEGNVLDAESLDVLIGNFDGRNTSTNGQTLDRYTVSA
jgi:hypothetical protein